MGLAGSVSSVPLSLMQSWGFCTHEELWRYSGVGNGISQAGLCGRSNACKCIYLHLVTQHIQEEVKRFC